MAASSASAGTSTGFNLQSEGLPFCYLAPKEGAFAWNQGYMLLKNAKNVEQAIEFAKFIATPEGSAHARRGVPRQPGGQGGDRPRRPQGDAPSTRRPIPGDALSKLWWWPIADQRVPDPAQRVRRQVPGGVSRRGPALGGLARSLLLCEASRPSR